MERQYICVSFEHSSSSRAKLTFYETKNGERSLFLYHCRSYAGRCGFTQKKTEGDGKTPIGIFTITSAFGTEKTEGLKIPYVVTNRHIWVDDPKSGYYNTMQSGTLEGDWKSCERLHIPAYKLALAVDYNRRPAIPYRGSAIFIHCMTEHPYTEGCIALQEKDMRCLISHIDICKKPVIVIDSIDNIKRKYGV